MTHHLYRFFNSADKLLYVGISLHVEKRFQQHRREKPWDEIARIHLERFPTQEDAAEAERQAIRTEHPAWNIVYAVPPSLLCDHCQRKSKWVFGWEDNKRYCSRCMEELDFPPPIKRPRPRTYLATAKFWWPEAEWIIGTGRFATLAYCRVLSIALHKTRQEAERALAQINSSGCGGLCYEDHTLVDIDSGDPGRGPDPSLQPRCATCQTQTINCYYGPDDKRYCNTCIRDVPRALEPVNLDELFVRRALAHRLHPADLPDPFDEED